MSDRLAATNQAAQSLIANFKGDAAFYAYNLTTGAEIGHEPDRVMPTASTIKILVLAELFNQVNRGEIDLESKLTIQPGDFKGGSGILKDLARDVLLSVRDHAVLMTALSDNTSTATLVRLCGREHILASAREWGLANTEATFERGYSRRYAISTPRDIVRLLTLIATDGFISPTACAAMRDILVTQAFHEQIGRYLPYNQYQRERANHPGPVVIRSKSGWTVGIRVDAGIVDLPDNHRYAICLMTENSPDGSFLPEHPGFTLNGKLSKLVFDAWWPDGVDLPRD